jgi:hypothetical protein
MPKRKIIKRDITEDRRRIRQSSGINNMKWKVKKGKMPTTTGTQRLAHRATKKIMKTIHKITGGKKK